MTTPTRLKFELVEPQSSSGRRPLVPLPVPPSDPGILHELASGLDFLIAQGGKVVGDALREVHRPARDERPGEVEDPAGGLRSAGRLHPPILANPDSLVKEFHK